MFEILVFLIAIGAGSIASIAGFGIGSLLTPAFAIHFPLKVAVAAVAIPHFFATAVRFWMLRAHVDRKLLWSFGIFSAIGGLTGALAHRWATSPILTIIFGAALVLAGGSELSGAAKRVRLRGTMAWIAGAASGLLGGLVGNQGGIRSAALLGFQTTRESFVATATAVALMVDTARLPIYLWLQGEQLQRLANIIAIASVGCLIGTFWGRNLLQRIPPQMFRRSVALLIFLLGAYMVFQGLWLLRQSSTNSVV